MTGKWRAVPWVVVGLSALYILARMDVADDASSDYQVQEFGRLPVVHQGRCKPIDTFARNSLMFLSGKQTVSDDSGKTITATRWVLDLMTDQIAQDGPSMKYKIFKIENDQVLGLLGLQERSGLRYSLSEFWEKRMVILKSADEASQLPEEQRDLFQRKVIELARKMQMWFFIRTWVSPHVVPPQTDKEEWKPLDDAMSQVHETKVDNPIARGFFTMLLAYAQGDVRSFNAEISKYRSAIEPRLPEAAGTRFEFFFNHFQPFYLGLVLYVIVFVLVFISWLAAGEALRKSALWLLMLTFGLHTFALWARMHIGGRPPVTNLYSSAVFIGWVSVILGMILERFNRQGIGTMVGAGMGFTTLIIAHNLAVGGTDTLEMMRAVLDTNFWLATHVTCITIGYSATFIAGFLGILTILRGALTTSLDRESMKNLYRMTYGIICFAMLFSFVGTVLGGIWADQSWGRFWGWDPKENGALIIVLWNALILHARWGGLARERGLAILAVGGNIVTAWSWFGVNLLSVGLHSYGFTDSGAMYMLLFVASQLAIVGVGLLPPHRWRSLSAVKE